MSAQPQLAPPNAEEILVHYLLDLSEFGLDPDRCQWRPANRFPQGSEGEGDEDEDYFAQVIGPAVWAWAEANNLEGQVSILVVEGGMEAETLERFRHLETYLGSTARGHHYFGPVVPYQANA